MPMWMRVFFVVLLGATGFYVHRRASDALGLRRRGRVALGGLLVAGAVAAVLGRVVPEALSPAVAEGVTLAGSMVALGVIISVCLLLPVDLARGVARLGQRLLEARRRRRAAKALTADAVPTEALAGSAPVTPVASIPMARRAFLYRGATGAALVVGSGSSIYGSLFGRHDYRIEDVVVPIPGLARTLEGFTLVQLSDLHLGTFVGEAELRAAEALTREARPDAIVITGDLLDHDEAYAGLLGRFLRRLVPLARHGVFAVPGNHDYYAGVEAVLSTVERAGAHVLRNAGRVLGDAGGAFGLLGVDDPWASRNRSGHAPDLGRALAMVPPEVPRVLLCHNPVFFPEAAGHVALQLSGHTHGGQVNLIVRPADVVLPYGYVAGMYERGPARLYVNRGFGTAGPPARVGSPPEVSRIVLVAA